MFLRMFNFLQNVLAPKHHDDLRLAASDDQASGRGIPLPENDFGLLIVNRPGHSSAGFDEGMPAAASWTGE